jgi:8-oxo-dGTP pyrophosphatase MutT (NUDIX family)
MKPTVVAGRIAYRVAHLLLRAIWFVTRPEIHGVKCVITDGDRLLLVRHTYGRREWDLPGGGIKRGESDADAARREMHEELGVDIAEWQWLGSIKASPYHSRDTLHCFQAELHDPTLTLQAIEIAAARWFSRAELPSGLGRSTRRVLALLDGDVQGTPDKNARAAADSGASR